MTTTEEELLITEVIQRMEASPQASAATDVAAIMRVLIARGLTSFEDIQVLKHQARAITAKALRVVLTAEAAGGATEETIAEAVTGPMMDWLKTGKIDG